MRPVNEVTRTRDTQMSGYTVGMEVAFTLVAVYVFCTYVGVRLFVPYFGFQKSPVPRPLPERVKRVVGEMSTGEGQREILEHTYRWVTTAYYGSRIQTVTNFWRAFQKPWEIESGFLPCTGQNHLLRCILIGSGRFSDDDIQVCAVPFNFFIHQYLRVRVGGSGFMSIRGRRPSVYL